MRQRPHRSAPSAASGSAQTGHAGLAAFGIASQHDGQTPPRKSSSTERISHARQREGRKYFAAARPIRWSAVAAGITSPFRFAILDCTPEQIGRDGASAASVHRVKSKEVDREVPLSIRKKLGLALVIAGVSATPAFAEDWGVGASIGLVNDIERHFRLEDFRARDGNAWVDFRLEERVLLRGTFGSMKANGDNAGRVVEVDGSDVVLPDLKVRIDYATVGVSYQFWEGDYTSGLFGGIGGYKVNPDPAPSVAITNFRDRNETVFGWHLGVDGDLRVLSRLSIVGRLTFHQIYSESRRALLTANAGAVFRF